MPYIFCDRDKLTLFLSSFLTIPQLGLLGFLAVLGLSKLSAREAKVQIDEPSTPKKKSGVTTRSKSGTPIEQKTGTIMTPAGRRSARIARTRKED